ncbi:alpha/beta fold hydrolase [Streptomyces armeniacus]|uniref:Alpha/beta fold hydrolase n=1 Tax=Streptomyces armeniacus TaxID=83291 RepID=A0A345XIU7_9ACTN|nr:alpha/beta hydrolase [Streptomyces armeniacus]AXK31563.1 alpha/beta fold hydrolase [Streptomyces armeniacus]
MSKPPTLDLPAGARAFRLATARGEFAAHEFGRAERGTALLLPGFTGSKEDFIALLEPLAEAGFRVVAVDGRGQHESAGPRDEAAYGQDELASDVLALLAAVGGPCHLVGHSLGGQIARAAVLRDASRVASLTLMSSGPAAVCAAQQARLKMLLGALTVMDMEAVWQAMRELDPPEAADEQTPPAVREFLHRRWINTAPEQLSATAQQLLGEPDRVPELAALPLPLHVLSGERDYVWPVPLLDGMAARLGARRTVIAGAEHSPNVDRPRETARELVRGWHEAASRADRPAD